MARAAAVVANIRNALRNLNPNDVRKSAQLPFTIELHASSPRMYEQMENFFTPSNRMSEAKLSQVVHLVRRAEGSGLSQGTVIPVYEKGLAHASPGFAFDSMNPDQVVRDIIEAHPELRLSLARRICPFREAVSKEIIWQVSRENTLFAVATAVPSIVPFISLPWAIGEFASDTAFLTANQIRMAFMLAAANDRTVGYREQKAEVASLFAGAFGWRAIARELAGKIPAGGGIIAKASVSFAGTYVIGASLERLYRVGYGFTPAERQQAYQQAIEKGKSFAAALLEKYRPQRNT
jgi:hypothetical protein